MIIIIKKTNNEKNKTKQQTVIQRPKFQCFLFHKQFPSKKDYGFCVNNFFAWEKKSKKSYKHSIHLEQIDHHHHHQHFKWKRFSFRFFFVPEYRQPTTNKSYDIFKNPNHHRRLWKFFSVCKDVYKMELTLTDT